MTIISNKQNLINIKYQLEAAIQVTPQLDLLKSYLDGIKMFGAIEYDENYLKYQVFSHIAYYSGYHISEINLYQNLKIELGLNQTEKWALSKKFNSLIVELGGKKYITRDEMDKVEFVKDCIKLIDNKLK